MINLFENPSHFWIIAVAFSLTVIGVVTACLCGCRKRAPKNELLGLDGMMKITNPDENVNHLPPVGIYGSQGLSEHSITESDDQFKRPSGGSNPHRSLPDIPVSAEGDVRASTDNGVSGDTSSELYATVDDKTLTAIMYSKRHTLPNGIGAGPSLSHQSSLSQSDSNYAHLKENPYDKVKKNEHRYANVQSGDSEEQEEAMKEQSPTLSSNLRGSESVDKAISERSFRSSRQNSVGSNGLATTSTADIPAAPAVAGRVAASQELPYMTPPISQPQYFSGDSQDSSRGYTSISVREPLANIINQTPAIRNRKPDLDPHYSTVSDDSDEMYAAIVEPNNSLYTSGSETYAQIQPLTTAEIHEHPVANTDSIQEDIDQYQAAPQPPSVDSLKHVAHVHSRQASSSSCTSSVANLGSPKPEKRQANSPLPPPPAKDESHPNSTVVRNLEDMYAKVHKNKKKSEDDKSQDLSTEQEDEEQEDLIVGCTTIQEHCYETLNKRKSTRTEGTWCETSGPESLLSNDPGYEQLRNRAPSENDPNYEVLRPHRTSSTDKSTLTVPDGYAQVRSPKGEDEPNYESMPCESESDPNYESVKTLHPKSSENEPDPSYESVKTIHQKSTESESDPNYESVKYLDVTVSEPPYERLQDDDGKDASDLSEYEQIAEKSGYERIEDKNSDLSDEHSETSARTDGKDTMEVNMNDLETNDVFHV